MQIFQLCEGFKSEVFWVSSRKEDSWSAGVGCSTGSDCVATGSGVSMTSAMPQALKGLVGCWARSGLCFSLSGVPIGSNMDGAFPVESLAASLAANWSAS